MTWVFRLLNSTVGRKLVMAVTGVVLLGFVIGHLAGNLLVYRGREALNAYAAQLHHLPALLWGARLVLAACTALHGWAATVLTIANLRARPVGYRELQDVASSYASRTMVWSGPLLALFVGYHLAHLTFGSAHPQFVEGDVYQNVVSGFQRWPVVAFYVVAMSALGLHLYHGVWSMLQSLGVSHPRFNAARRVAAAAITFMLVAGNISIPVAVLLGVLR